jgi:prepilin signal peptidase PulO-like enzyme (type II secretory pathway)
MKRLLGTILSFAKFASLPVIFSIYPVMFHYGNNLGVATLSSAIKIGLWFIILAAIVYFLMLVVGKFRSSQAANASIVLLFCLLYYGLIFEQLRKLDVVTIEHYSLLPFLLFLSIYLIGIILKMSTASSIQFWRTALFVLVGLLVFNVVPVILVNVRLISGNDQNNLSLPVQTETSPAQNFPDIYYIVFDEMAAFEVARKYFGYDDINGFVDYLNNNGFYVAENSHGDSASTLREMARRLNYETFPFIEDEAERNLLARRRIQNNRAMQFLKSHGYTTIVFADEHLEISVMPPVDITYTPPDNHQTKNDFLAIDEFIVLVLRNTMILPWIQPDIVLPFIEHSKQKIFFAIEEVPSLETPSPKFVYVHLLIPHWPFLFDQDGRLNETEDFYSWDKYFGYYIYSLDLARVLLDGIINSSDSSLPPVIIFQSDHGARNTDVGSNTFENYPDEYKTWIVNALRLPGCEDAPLTQNMDPVNTLPIVFNCYFDAGIPLK